MKWLRGLWDWLCRYFADEPTPDERDRQQAAATLAEILDIGVYEAGRALTRKEWRDDFETIAFAADPKAIYEEFRRGWSVEDARDRVSTNYLDSKKRTMEAQFWKGVSSSAKEKHYRTLYRVTNAEADESTTGSWSRLPYIGPCLEEYAAPPKPASLYAHDERDTEHARPIAARQRAVIEWDRKELERMRREERERKHKEERRAARERKRDIERRRAEGWTIDVVTNDVGDWFIVNSEPPLDWEEQEAE